ncbi:MAG: acyclic terpene utilization AtuA family protein, partial [Acetobacteraceae bacterium]
AKIIECASLCCVPGGRDCILATLDDEGFELESMNPTRRATPVSVAAHSLYEQSDPFGLTEPDGSLDLVAARYAALDDRRTRVTGAAWRPSREPTIKLEGARRIGERAILLAGAADPRFIAGHREILRAAVAVVRDLVCEDQPEDYTLTFRVYGVDGVRMAPPANEAPPGEVFVLGEVIAPTAERAAEVMRTTKQYLLHHGYPGRLSTAGNLAFPFTPPEISTGPAFRFNVYHLLHVADADALFPLEIETL